MKCKLFYVVLLFCYSVTSLSQVSISTDNALPDKSAMLDVKSANKGVLVTRLSYEAIAQIIDPANGLLVFCTTNNKFYVFDASANVWREIAYGQGIITPGGTLVPGLATGTQTIGFGETPTPLVSAPPTGGSGFYSFQWQRSFTINSFFDIFTEISLSYQPGPANQTSYYRLRQVDAVLHDTVYTNTLTVTVSPQLIPGIAGTSQTICNGAVPSILHATPPTGGSGNYSFQWQKGTVISSFFDIFTEISLDYQPGPLTQTTYYRLRQIDAQFHDTVYTNILAITVNPPMVSGIAGDFQMIANNTAPQPIHSLFPTGGSGNFIYQWKYHECDCGPMPCDSLVCGPVCSGAPWLQITGATSLIYSPGVLNHGKCYRMFSTDVTCNQIKGSNYVHIYIRPPFVAGTATANQTICYGTTPAMLHATPPTGGGGNYVYQWQKGYVISSFFDIFTEMSLDYQPGALTQTTFYRLRQVDVQFHDTVFTNILTITVNPQMVSGIAGDFQMIGNNTAPQPIHSLLPTGGSGNFIYQWKYHECDCGPMPCDSLVCGPGCSGAPWLQITGATSLIYSPGVLNHGKCYRMYSTDITCNQIQGSNYVHIYIKPPFVAGTAAANQIICHGTTPAMLHATPPTGGGGNYAYQWQKGYVISSFFDIFTEMSLDYQPGALTQTTYYRLRQVDTQFHDTVYTNVLTIAMLPLITPGTAGPDQTIPPNSLPAQLISSPPGNGCGDFSYQWQSGFIINSFFDIFTEIFLSYQPGPLAQTTYYRLRQIDNIGHDTVYTNTVTITVPASPWVCGNPLNDIRDGKIYTTIQIGLQCWMAQNLNVGVRISAAVPQTGNSTIEKYCFGNIDANCNIYGGLYQWNELMNYSAPSNANPSGRQGICPTSWHIPSEAEWCQMNTFLDGSINCSAIGWLGVNAGGKLKETGTSHWALPNTGATNLSGFTALPGGYSVSGGSFSGLTNYANFWTSAENSPTEGWYNYQGNLNEQTGRYFYGKSYGFSARCIKD